MLAAPLVVRGLATMETALARVLLGPGTRALAARVAPMPFVPHGYKRA